MDTPYYYWNNESYLTCWTKPTVTQEAQQPTPKFKRGEIVESRWKGQLYKARVISMHLRVSSETPQILYVLQWESDNGC